MAQTTEARDYAAAFLAATQESWQADLQKLERELAEGTTLRTAVRVARSQQEEVHALIAAALPGTPAPMVNLATLLVTANQVDLIPAIASELQTQMTGSAGPLKAQITSAVTLTADRQAALRSYLEAEHGNELDLQFLVDPGLIGGLRIRVGDNLTDLSVASQLQSLRDEVLTSV